MQTLLVKVRTTLHSVASFDVCRLTPVMCWDAPIREQTCYIFRFFWRGNPCWCCEIRPGAPWLTDHDDTGVWAYIGNGHVSNWWLSNLKLNVNVAGLLVRWVCFYFPKRINLRKFSSSLSPVELNQTDPDSSCVISLAIRWLSKQLS